MEYSVIIYEIKAIAKTKVVAESFTKAKEQLPKLVKKLKFKPHKEYRMVYDI